MHISPSALPINQSISPQFTAQPTHNPISPPLIQQHLASTSQPAWSLLHNLGDPLILASDSSFCVYFQNICGLNRQQTTALVLLFNLESMQSFKEVSFFWWVETNTNWNNKDNQWNIGCSTSKYLNLNKAQFFQLPLFQEGQGPNQAIHFLLEWVNSCRSLKYLQHHHRKTLVY